MQTTHTIFALIFLASTALTVSTGMSEEKHGTKKTIPYATSYDVEYVKECGACHIPYPPQLLPKSSWEKMLGDLTNHFGENAELDAAVQTRLTTYLQNASKPAKSTEQTASLRISEQRWFIKDHNKIPAKVFNSQPGVKSLSFCDSCHPNAVKGSFEENEINIPGIGRWED